MPTIKEKTPVIADKPAKEKKTGPSYYNGPFRLCMSCVRRPATRIKTNANGRKQYRCDICYVGKNPSGFSGGK